MYTDYLGATERLSNQVNAIKFEMVIKLLREIEMDGETTQYLLRILGEEEQMFGQLLRKRMYGLRFEEGLSDLISFL